METPAGLRGTLQLWPVEDLVLAADWSLEPVRAPDHVLRVTAPARTLAALTIRRTTSSVLDVGCGTGYHALRAAGRAGSLTATDINPRALHVTRLNAALNDVTVECLQGDLFAPVAGRRFGLVVALPPFVVAPEGELTFLSVGTSDDGICRRLAREVPEHLEDGGFCQFLAQWAVPDGVSWDDHLAGWFDDGITAWVLRLETEAPAAYAARTLEPMCADDHEFAARLDHWVAALARRGIGAIGTGLVTLRRGGPSWRRFDDAPSGLRRACGDDVAAGFAATDVARTASDDALLALRAEAAPGAEIVQRLRFRDGALQPDSGRVGPAGCARLPWHRHADRRRRAGPLRRPDATRRGGGDGRRRARRRRRRGGGGTASDDPQPPRVRLPPPFGLLGVGGQLGGLSGPSVRSAAVVRADSVARRMLRLRRPAIRGASRTLAAVAHSTVFTWKGRSSGCFGRTSAAMPAMCGAA